MRYQSLVAFALSAASVEAGSGKLGDAVPVDDNPAGVTYVAKLPDTPFSPINVEGNVKGSVTATSGADGKGVDFKVKFSNFPTEGGPFSYHLHVAPVPEDGNCTQTLAHLDPFIRGEDPPCDPETPEDCEVGDLSSKHGKADSDPFELTFNDPYASLKEGIGAFFGNRSLVVHFANKTRITCANFELVTGSDDKTGDEDCEDDDDDEEESHGSKGPDASETADGGSEKPDTTGGSHGTAVPSAPPTASGGPEAGESFIPSAATLSTVSLLGALGAAVFAL